MTVIAANRQMLSGDRATSDSGRRMKCQKVYDVNGDFIGFAGLLRDGLAFVDWYKAKGEKPVLDDSEVDGFCALVLTKTGELWYYDSTLVKQKIYEKHHAIGSGAQYAICAMDLGKTPEEAAKLAAKSISGCRPPIDTLRRTNASPKRKRK